MKLQSKSDNIVPINRFRMSKINHSIHIFTLCLTITTFDSKKLQVHVNEKEKEKKWLTLKRVKQMSSTFKHRNGHFGVAKL